jgi:Fungal specific transcription factor domain
MFSVAARYTSDRDGDRPPPESAMWPEGDVYLEEAKRLLDSSYSSSRPATCQALLLMGYREIGIGAMAQAWLYVGMAIRMAQDLGIHKSADQWMHGGTSLFSPVELQERRRIWYGCVIMDKYVSSYIGRPLSIYERDFDTEIPSIDEVRQSFHWKKYWPSTTRLV